MDKKSKRIFSGLIASFSFSLVIGAVLILSVIFLCSDDSDAQNKDRRVQFISPYGSIRSAKTVEPLDFLVEINWLEVDNFIVDKFKFQMGYERQEAKYYWSNDYRITWFGLGFKDFRRDDRGLHNTELFYTTDKIPYVCIGSSVLVDKNSDYFITAITEFKWKGIRARYQKGKSKTIYDCEFRIIKPLKQYLFFQTYGEVKGIYYWDTDFNSLVQFTVGFSFALVNKL